MKYKASLHHPFYEVAANCQRKIAEGAEIFQQWQCAHCFAKQTMPDANHFYKLGDCEECGKRTNIEQDGCNFLMIKSGADALEELIGKLPDPDKAA